MSAVDSEMVGQVTIEEAIQRVVIEASLLGECKDVGALESDLLCIMAHNGGWIVNKPYQYSIRRTVMYYKWTGGERALLTGGGVLVECINRALRLLDKITCHQSTPAGLVIAWKPR